MTKEFENEVDRAVEMCNEAAAKARSSTTQMLNELRQALKQECGAGYILRIIKDYLPAIEQQSTLENMYSKKIDRLTEEAYDAWNGKAAD